MEMPKVKVLFAGEYQHVIGERTYRKQIEPLMEGLGDHWTFLGVLNPEQMATFFSACDVTVLPSINRTESFGLVQVESMLCGTPVVATDLPGVRVPVRVTNMGRIVPSRNAEALAEALLDVLRDRQRYIQPRDEIEHQFSIEKTVKAYESLFEELI
jgi:glycosyltransferase involved in cell wall biosynthesis